MRLSVALGCLLLLGCLGCSGPHSTGALWAQQNVERELALFRLTDTQRADRAHVFELSLADATLADERSRIQAGLHNCPGDARQALGVSVGDRARDTVRLRVQDDRPRQAAVAQVALADWLLRRAQALGDTGLCDQARQALDGQSSTEPTASNVLERLGTATVTRDPQRSSEAADTAWPANVMLSTYALGYVDTVQAAAPLPAYLAVVYGGVLVGSRTVQPVPSGESAAALVDRLAPAYPDWEPDALYAAFTAP